MKAGFNFMRRYLICAVLFFVSGTLVQAQPRSKSKTINRIAKKAADVYKAKNLGALDAERLVLSKVKIVIEHSLLEELPFETKFFRSFKSVERWLKSREGGEEGSPFRQVQTFTGCRKGRCSFDQDGGILHNQLYLKRIYYGFRNGRAYIKELYFLDGD